MINVQRMILAGLAAGVWVFVSGMAMAAVFGYRDIKTAFDVFGIPIPKGTEPFVVHTLVRLLTGMAVAALFAILLRIFAPTPAMLGAAGFTWFVGVVLPFAVIAQWGLFSWSLVARMWGWSAGELLVAAAIARWLYHS